MSRPTVTELATQTLSDFETTDDVVFVAYINAEDETSRAAYTAVAGKYHEEFTFGLISDDSTIKSHDQESPSISCRVVEDGQTRNLKSFSGQEAIEKFVLEASRRFIGELLPYDQSQQRVIDVSRAAFCKLCGDLSDHVDL